MKIELLTKAKRALSKLTGTKEEHILQDRLALIDAALALHEPAQNEHTLLTNLNFLKDHFDSFPVLLTISLTEHMVKFRIARVLSMDNRDERLAAIDSLVGSFEVWTGTSTEGILDGNHASYIPVIHAVELDMNKSGKTFASGFGGQTETLAASW